MKKLVYIFSIVCFLAFSSCSGDIFNNIEEHATKEKVYVGKYDKADVHIGIKRVEIDLMDAGRIPKEKMNIGKAVKTIVEYDNKEFEYEVQSWINIPNLTEPKMYRIKVYNLDELGNKSIPVEVAVFPFTDVDLNNLVIPVPTKLLAPKSIQVNWSNDLISDFYDFYEWEYSFTDAQGNPQTLKSTDNKSLLILNIAEGSSGTVNLKAKVVPKQNGTPILDTVYLESSIDYQLPTEQQYLNARSNRKIKNPFIEGNTATVTWGEVPEHLVVTELTYETVSGSLNTVITKASETTVECPDAKTGVLYKTRSGFVPPGAVDTLYKDWVTSKYPFLTFPTGTFTVDPLSYIYFGATGEPRFPLPQGNYAAPRTVTIEAIEEATYRISDLIGGYYEIGAGYGADFAMWAIFTYDGVSTWTIIDAKMDTWGTGFYRMSGNYNEATKTVSLNVPWGSAPVTEYVFNVILHKQ